MPITSSAQKALRQNRKRRLHNLTYRNSIKSFMKKGLILAKEEKRDELKSLLPSIYKALDKAAKVGVIKKNTAARRKSLITKKLAALSK